MRTQFPYDELVIYKCEEEEWSEILEVLKETKMHIWLIGKPDYKKYFVVRDSRDGELILFFTFSIDGDIGILKNVVCSKKYQRQGIGTYIVNEKIPYIARSLGLKKLYLHGNDRGLYTSNNFWKKSIFKHVKSVIVEDQFYKEYFDHLVKNYSDDVLCAESIFCLDIQKYFN